MSLARETAREEKASMFHDMRESLWVTWLCAFLEDTGVHIRVEGLKAERVRQSLLVAMAVVESRKEFKYRGGLNRCPSTPPPTRTRKCHVI